MRDTKKRIITGGGILLILVYSLIMLALSLKPFLVEQPARIIVSSSLPAQALWQVQIDEPVFLSPVIANNRVIVSSSETIYGLDLATGQQVWKHSLSKQPSVPLANAANKILYGDNEGSITALDIETGKLLWRREAKPFSHVNIKSMVVSNDVVYVAAQPTTEIWAINLETGQLIWYVNGPDHNIPSRGALLFLWNDDLYVFTTEVHILDAKTGEIKQELSLNLRPAQLENDKFYASQWVREIKTLNLVAELQSPSYKFLWGNCEEFAPPYTFSIGQFFTIGNCGGVYALDEETYKINWTYREDALGQSPTAIYRGNLYILFNEGEIHAINPKTGQSQGVLKTNLELPQVVPGSISSNSIVANETVLVVTFGSQDIWAFCESSCF